MRSTALVVAWLLVASAAPTHALEVAPGGGVIGPAICPSCPNSDCSLCQCPYPTQTHSVQLAIAGTARNDSACSYAYLGGSASTDVAGFTYGAGSGVTFFTTGSIDYDYSMPFTLEFELPGCVPYGSAVRMGNPRITWGTPVLAATDDQSFATYIHMYADFPLDFLDELSVGLVQFPDHIRLFGTVPVSPALLPEIPGLVPHNESFNVTWSDYPFDEGKACYSGICATLGGHAPTLYSGPTSVGNSGTDFIVAQTEWATTPSAWSSSADQVELAGNILLTAPTTVVGAALLALHELGFSLDTHVDLGISRRETAALDQLEYPNPWAAVGAPGPTGEAFATFSIPFSYLLNIDSDYSYPASFGVDFDGPGFDAQNLVTVSPGTNIFSFVDAEVQKFFFTPLGVDCVRNLDLSGQAVKEIRVPVHVGYGTTAPPVASAGPAQTVHVGTIVTLDASASSDPYGHALTYTWSIAARPTDSVAVLSSATAVNPTFTPDLPGDYVLSLTVTNSEGVFSTPATVVVSTTNSAPIAEAGIDVSVTQDGTEVILDGRQSYDPDGDAISYAWSLVVAPTGSAAALDGATTSSPSFVADVFGQYVLQLVVSDPWVSGLADSVTVSFLNLRPVANAGAGGTVDAGTLVVLDGSASSDPNGDPITYAWSLVSAPAGSASSIGAPGSQRATLLPDLEGTFVVQLVVNDGLLNSDPSSIQIQSVMTSNAAIEAVKKVQQSVAALTTLKNANMKIALTNKLNAVAASIQAGDYPSALAQLQDDILGKTDGCAKSSPAAPDRNDWVTSCAEQAVIQPLVLRLIADVNALM